ncbi:hypothetical protein FF041_01380 [Streptomyces jumonjinensis]|uniref:Uncharacterized protein n=1 Tax=Streptomyces jumonjinensis TaxID=1945 RepID=A0A646K9Y2_STRJU|nr:hypothetical protein [Streptomyces jumonjinensis]
MSATTPHRTSGRRHAARLAGCSPGTTIHRVYEGCIYGQEATMNAKIEQELDWPGEESAGGDGAEA